MPKKNAVNDSIAIHFLGLQTGLYGIRIFFDFTNV